MDRLSKVQMFLGEDNKWRFRIRFSNGRIAATSESYSSYRSAYDSADSLCIDARSGNFDLFVDESAKEKLDDSKAKKKAAK